MNPADRPLTLGVKPYHAGIAWAAFENPLTLYDWGQRDARGEKNAKSLAVYEDLLDRFSSRLELVVVEDFQGRRARQSPRVRRLLRGMVTLARGRGIDVVWMSRGDVQTAFAAVGAKHRYEVACAVARSFEQLRAKLPNKRRQWETVPRTMALFDAAALVLTHYQLATSQLFSDLARGSDRTDELDADAQAVA